jgi:hypothetical protein
MERWRAEVYPHGPRRPSALVVSNSKPASRLRRVNLYSQTACERDARNLSLLQNDFSGD